MTKRRMKYNPSFLTEEELIDSFVVRNADLDLIVNTIAENCTDSNQHILIIGPRGSGKTTMIHRVAAEIARTDELHARWYPLIFSEESYEVVSAGEFWLEALFHLAEQSGEEKWQRTHRELKNESDDQRLAERALAQLLDFADSIGKRIVVMVENLNMLLGDMTSEEEAWKIRHTLSNEPRLMLLATATCRFEHIENASKAMFEMFKMQELKPLDDDECNLVWEHITGQKLLGERIKPIRILTGGNPRLLTIIAKFSAHRSFHKLLDDVVNLIDDHTEYFKSHLDSLPSTERKVYLALCGLWDASTAREIAQEARIDINKTSSLLSRLVNRGAITVEPHGKKTKWYVVAERMYNIYYLMRRRGKPSDRVKATVKFLTSMYDHESATRLITEEACALPPELRNNHCLAYEAAIAEIPDRAVVERIIAATPKEFLESPYISETVRNWGAMKSTSASKNKLVKPDNDALKEAELLNGQGVEYGKSHDYEQAVKMFNTVISKFAQSTNTEIRTVVSGAMFNRGYALSLNNQPEEAIAAYDEVISRFADAPERELREQVAKALMNKGITLGLLNRPEEEIAAYDEVITRFADTPESVLREQVAKALVNKGHRLGQLDRFEEAIATYDAVIARFADAQESVLHEPVARALVNKGSRLGQLDRSEEEIATYDAVIARFADAQESVLRKQVAMALVNKGSRLGQLNRSEEAIAAYDEVIARFADAQESVLREHVARALVNKGYRLGQLNRSEEAIAAYDEVIARFADTPESALREQVAKALVNKGYRLGQLNRPEEAIAAYDAVITRFADAPESVLHEPVARALVNKGSRLGQLDRSEEEIATYDAVIARFADAPESVVHKQVAKALVNKGSRLGQLNRSEEAIAAYDEVIARFADAQESVLREQVARALVNKGYRLGQLNRSEEAIAAYDEVIARFADTQESVLREQMAMALVNKGYQLGQLNRPEEEIATYDAVIAWFADAQESVLRKQVAMALVNKGIALGQLNRSEEEIASYDAVIARFADADKVVFQDVVLRAFACKSRTHDELGEYESAETTLRKAITYAPDSTLCTIQLIELYLKIPNRLDDVFTTVEVAISSHMEDADLLNSIAWALYSCNHVSLLDKAEQLAAKATSLIPGNSYFNHTVACILTALGRGHEALAHAKRYLQDIATVEKTIDDAIELFVEFAAAGQGREALVMLENSEAARHLEPLVVGLKMYLGEEVKTAPEIKEVAKDVVRRIEERKRLRESSR